MAKTGPKAAVAARIVARAQVLDRLLYLGDDPARVARTFGDDPARVARTFGDDPARVARTFKAESLRRLTAELGGFLGVPKYGLAAHLVGRRDTLLRSMQQDLTNGT